MKNAKSELSNKQVLLLLHAKIDKLKTKFSALKNETKGDLLSALVRIFKRGLLSKANDLMSFLGYTKDRHPEYHFDPEKDGGYPSSVRSDDPDIWNAAIVTMVIPLDSRKPIQSMESLVEAIYSLTKTDVGDMEKALNVEISKYNPISFDISKSGVYARAVIEGYYKLKSDELRENEWDNLFTGRFYLYLALIDKCLHAKRK